MPHRIVIITPGAIGSNPRVVKEADALHEAGYQVHVCSTRTLDAVDQLDEALLRRVNWKCTRIDLRSRFAHLAPRLLQTLAMRTWEVTGWAALSPTAFSAFTGPLYREVLRHQADLYIAHYPPALPVAAKAARIHKGCYAYDAEDFHLGDWPEDDQFDAERRLLRQIEGNHLSGCAYVTASSPATADAYASAYDRGRPLVVLNVFPLEAGATATNTGTAEPGPSVYWFSQTIGPNRGLESAVRALGLSRARPNLYLRGSPAAGFMDVLNQLSYQVGAVGRLHFLAAAAPDEMLRLASAYDIGLCSETGFTPNNARALSNKLFTYLSAGLAPAMSDTPAQKTFAAEAGLTDLLYPINDAASLAALFDRVLGDPTVLANVRERAFRCARERYNWDFDRRTLLTAVENSLSANRDSNASS